MATNKRIDLRGKVALITGAGSGIGAATARQLHEKGAKLVLLDVTEHGINNLADEFGSSNAVALVVDVTDRKQLEGAVATAVDKFGGVDIAFANAGIACDPPTTMAGMDEKIFERIIEVDLLGVTRTVQACLPQIVSRQGHILVTASTSAFINGMANIPYGIAKAGVEMLARSLRVELASTGATAGVLLPCWTRTPIAESALGGHELAAELVRRGFPSFLRQPISAQTVASGAVRAIETRAASMYRPRRWSLISLVRGFFNPVSDYALARNRHIQDLIMQLEHEGRQRSKTGAD